MTDDRQAGTEHRAVREREHPRHPRRPDRAGRHQAPSHRAASLRDVLAAAQVRRVRRLGNVDVVADHRDLAGPDAMGRAAGVHHARVLPPAHPRARRLRHPGAGRPEGQARRRAGISADRRDLGPRRAAARVRRASARHRIVHGAHAGDEPRRRDRLQAAGGRHRPPDPADHQHRRDDGAGELDATLLYLTHANLVDRSRIDLVQATPASSRCSTARPRPSATSPRPASTRSTTAW